MDMQQAIADLFAREEATAAPSPGVALRVASLMRARDFPLGELERLAMADPAMAVDLLCSAAGVDASLPDAIARIGERGLFTIASNVARQAETFAVGPLVSHRRAAWRHSIVSAVLCRELANERGLAVDDAYACGLLHDVGTLVALSAVERISSGTRAGAGAPGWQRIVRRWHAPLGAVFASRRGLPSAVTDAIALHHSDSPLPPGRSPELVRVVRTVDAVLRALGGDLPGAADIATIAELSAREAERLAAARDTIVRHVDALDVLPAPRRGPVPGAMGRRANHCGVLFRIGLHEYAATSFALGQIVISGPASLDEGTLLDVEPFEPEGPPFQAVVVAAWQEGDRHRAIVAPLASPGASPAETVERGVA